MRSLEFNWLRWRDRSLVIPEVVYVSKPVHPQFGTECGGFYCQPGKYELRVEDQFYDGAFGVIVVAADAKCDGRSTLAHEWRHHWQRHNGIAFDSALWDSRKHYETAIRQYFRNSKCEIDALRFETAVAPSDVNDYWMSLVA